ncbi:MAG: MFS transporter [Pseudomonadota bacterium]
MSDSSATHEHTATLDEVITTVIMSRVTDFFGFFVYGIACVLVFPQLFFPMVGAVEGTMLAFVTFAIAFVVRPFAQLGGRAIQRRIGKIAKITIALFILGTSTVAIGLLPGYERIGWAAPAALIALRIAQGVGLGLGWDGITLQLRNAAPEGYEARYAMVAQLGGPFGFAVAASLFYVLTGFLTVEEFYQYGWRFAFFAVMAVNVVSLFARIRLLQTDFGGDEESFKMAPFWELVTTQWRPIVLSTLLPIASYALFHMVTIFPLAYQLLYGSAFIETILLWQLIGAGFGIVTVIASGFIADKVGQRVVHWAVTLAIVLLCLTITTLDTNPAIYIILGFILLGFSYGQASSIVPGRFPKRFRYSGSALATNLSWIFGAAFAPLAGLGLTWAFGLWAASLYLLSGVVVTTITLYVLGRQERQELDYG